MRLSDRLRHGWESFANRTGMRLLPPVSAAIAVLAAGVLLPFVPRVDALPPQLAPSLASARIERFLRATAELPKAGPSGAIYASQPAFFWPERPGAESYEFRLFREDGTEQASAKGIKATFTLIPPPGRLAPGQYRFEVRAVAKGETVPWQEQSFTVRSTPEDLRRLQASMGMDFPGQDGDFVLLGCYAELGSAHDVISAFLQWKTRLGEAAALGNGPPSAWLATLDLSK